jgi:hypothetical protein
LENHWRETFARLPLKIVPTSGTTFSSVRPKMYQVTILVALTLRFEVFLYVFGRHFI